MARYIFCPACDKEWKTRAAKYNEYYESKKGEAIKDMLCDGTCGIDKAMPIKTGDVCFAAVLLPGKLHPNYPAQRPDAWAHFFIKGYEALKTYLCKEGDENFTITAKSLEEAREAAALWNATVIKQLK